MKKETASAIVLTLLIGSMVFSANIFFVKAQTDIHDLEAGLSSPVISGMYNHVLNGTSTVLNATVTNRGNVSESNVALELLINGSLSLYAVTPTLGINSTFWTAYYWSPSDGDYNLTVYTHNVTGETNMANNNVTRWVRVCPPQAPTANFTATWAPSSPAPGPVNSYSIVTFDASNSSDPDWDNITNYAWNFGDNNTETASYSNITHMYTAEKAWGPMNVTLTVWDAENLNGSMSQNITVYAQPVANFTIDPPRPGPYYVNETLLTFDASASYDPDNVTGSNNGIASYTWDFKDGNTTTVTNPTITHTYDNTGNYNVYLTVTDYVDLSGFTIVPLSVSPGNPAAIFTPPPQPCYVGRPLTFNASASSAHNGIASYTWDFKDGNTTTVTNPAITHTYDNTGNYNVNLTVTDNKGLTGSIKNTVTVYPEVFVRVVDASTGNTTINAYNPGQPFTMNITVSNVQNLYSYYFKLSWPPTWMPPTWLDLFDPTAFTVNYPSDGFLGPVQYSNGTTRISWEHLDRPYEGYVTVNATLKEDKPCSGNGTLATITFKVLTSGNCTLALSDIILSKSFLSITPINNTVENGTFYTSWPVANFTCSDLNPVVNSNVTFDASQSYDPDGGSITSYEWNFGDSNVTSTPNPKIPHSYNSTGPKNVNLTVTDNNGDKWWFNYTVNVIAGRDVGVVKIEPTMLAFNVTLGLYETAGVLPINVTVTNEGNISETFTVTVYYGIVGMENETVTNLAPGENATVVFNLGVKDVPKGVYNISAYAWPVLDETHTSDNNYTKGAVRVYLQGDINRDKSTDIYDAIILAGHYNEHVPWPHPQIDPNIDLYCDGVVDIYDTIILSSNFGKSDP